jgi:hypothetical protein
LGGSTRDVTGVLTVTVRALELGMSAADRNSLGGLGVGAVSVLESALGLTFDGAGLRVDFLVTRSGSTLRGLRFGVVGVFSFRSVVVTLVDGVAAEAVSGAVDAGSSGLTGVLDDFFFGVCFFGGGESDSTDVVDAASDGSASATPGIVPTARPTPSATASATTLPTYPT